MACLDVAPSQTIYPNARGVCGMITRTTFNKSVLTSTFFGIDSIKVPSSCTSNMNWKRFPFKEFFFYLDYSYHDKRHREEIVRATMCFIVCKKQRPI